MAAWSVAKRLKVGFGAFSGGILLLAAVGVAAATFLQGQFDQYSRMAFKMTEINVISSDVYAARLAAEKYLVSVEPDPERRARAEDRIRQIRRDAEGLLEAARLQPRVRALMREILAHSATYLAAFRSAAEAQAEHRSVFDRLQADAVRLQVGLADLVDASNRTGDVDTALTIARVQQTVMSSAAGMERYRQSSDTVEYERTLTGMEEAAQRLAWVANRISDIERVEPMETARTVLMEYSSRAGAIPAITASRHEAIGAMSGAEAELMSALDASVEYLEAMSDEVGAGIARTFPATIQVQAAIAVLALLGSLFLARSLLRRISGDFDRTLQTVGALAEGDLEVEIPDAAPDTEFGRLAQSLVVFRDRGREARDLARQGEVARRERQEAERQAEERERHAQVAHAEYETRAAEEHKREIFNALRAAVSGVVSSAAAGDFSRRVDPGSLDPEIADLAHEINRLMANVDSGLSEIAKVSERLAEGDLREGMAGEYEGTFRELQENIEAMMGALGTLLSDVAEEARSVAGQSAEMTSGADDLARRAESQAASLEQTSASITEIASSADSNAQAAAETNAAATVMSSEADQARHVLDSTVKAMGDIEEHAKEIEAIVDVIEDIAFQTNLLSLNASVEAARAGEAGKGFAVVANEVRALAQRSAEASSKVQQIITQSTGAISRGSSAVGETGEALSRIVDRIAAVSGNLREIKSASEEQAAAVKDISNALAQLDKITQKNAAVAEETRGAAALMAAQSDRMQETISRVRVKGAPITRREPQALERRDPEAA